MGPGLQTLALNPIPPLDMLVASMQAPLKFTLVYMCVAKAILMHDDDAHSHNI